MEIGHPRIILPVEVLEGEDVSPGVAELVGGGSVVLLGYHVIPEQTTPSQAEEQFGEKANDLLDEIEEFLLDHGAEVDRRMVFTHDREKSINRVAMENGCIGLLIPNPASKMERVLIPIKVDLALDRCVDIAGSIFPDSDIEITLLHIYTDDMEGEDSGILEKARDRLIDKGIPPDQITLRYVRGEGTVGEMVDEADEYDAVVMGETDPSLQTFLFGETSDKLADRFLGPVIVILRREFGEES